MKIVVWGTGSGTRNIGQICRARNVDVVAYVDNNTKRQGQVYCGKEIIGPQQLSDYAFDYIVVASAYYEAIKKQILSLGYAESRIIDYHGEKARALELFGPPCKLLLEQFTPGSVVSFETREYPFEFSLADNPSPVPLDAQLDMVADLVQSFKRAKAVQSTVPEAYQPGLWEGNFAITCPELGKLAAEDDIPGIAKILNNFWRHKISTYFLGGESAFERYKKSRETDSLTHNFQVWKYSTSYQVDLLDATMPDIGNPWGVRIQGRLLHPGSFPNHHKAWKMGNLLRNRPAPVVAEIGGGYGAFAYYLLTMNPNVTYMGFDLPETLLVASYYLKMAFPERRVLFFDDPERPLDKSLFENYDIILMPNFMLTKVADESVDLFYNTISMCEMYFPTITEYIKQIDRCGNAYFYNENIAHVPLDYNGFPAFYFPELKTFTLLSSGIARWDFVDAYSFLHTFREDLHVKKSLFCDPGAPGSAM